MRTPLLVVGALLTFAAACRFEPQFDPAAVKCSVEDRDSCPVGYVCGKNLDAGRGLCCKRGEPPWCDDPSSDAGATADLPPGDLAAASADEAPPVDLATDQRTVDTAADARAGDAAPDAPADLPSLDVPPPDGPALLDSAVLSDGPCPCTAGQTSCGPGGGLRSCEVVDGCGAWGPEVACPDRGACRGREPSAARCCAFQLGCNHASTPGWACAGRTARVRCDIDSDGCPHDVDVMDQCPPGVECDPDKYPATCTLCPPPPAECDGETQAMLCSGRDLATCGRDVHGCIRITVAACPVDKPCAGNPPKATCSCPTPPSDCPGVGRICGPDGTLDTCAVDATSGCLTRTGVACPSSTRCTGFLPSADCRCADGACPLHTVGRDTDLENTVSLEAGELIGFPLSIKHAFVPREVGLFIKEVPADAHIIFGLYTSDAEGEPDKLVAWSDQRDWIYMNGRMPIMLRYPLRIFPLPSGTYWLTVAVEKSTPIAYTGKENVGYRSVKYTWNDPLPSPFYIIKPITAGVTGRRAYFMTVQPQ